MRLKNIADDQTGETDYDEGCDSEVLPQDDTSCLVVRAGKINTEDKQVINVRNHEGTERYT